jgi:hypothetical protein
MITNTSFKFTSRYLDIANRVEEARALAESLLSGAPQSEGVYRVEQRPTMPVPQYQPPQQPYQKQAEMFSSMGDAPALFGGGLAVATDTQQNRALAFDDFSRRYGVDDVDLDAPPAKKRKRCEHGRRRSECKQCVGSCEHGHLARRCKACKLASEEVKSDKVQADGYQTAPPTPPESFGDLMARLTQKNQGNNKTSGLARALDTLNQKSATHSKLDRNDN